MKKALFVFAGLVLSSAAFADVEVELLTCSELTSRAHRLIQLNRSRGLTSFPNSSFWTVTEKPLNPMAESKTETISGEGRVVHLKGTATKLLFFG
ncbi:MAG: hypothetical protein IPJ71_19100 [Bdellovibrionales bacterium]|nr:hypothetical protein [Bdellovibrionales bacterium]